jgi:hypothetical protein
MLQLIIKFLVQNILKSAGPALAMNGIATSEQWQTCCGVIAAAIGWIWHWHESHAAAVAAGKVPPAALPPKLAGQVVSLILACLIPVFLVGCALPKDVAHVYHLSGDGTSLGITQNPATQAYELGLKRVHTTMTIVPVIWSTNNVGGLVAIVPDSVISDEINGRSTIFGGAGGTITVAVGSNAVQSILGGGHQPINAGSGTNLPK